MKFLIGTQSEKKETWIKWRRVINLNVTLWIVFFEPAIYLNPLRHFFVKQFFINVHREAIILGQPPPLPLIGTIFFGNLEQNLISPKLKFSISLLQYFSLVRIKLASQINIFFLSFFFNVQNGFPHKEKNQPVSTSHPCLFFHAMFIKSHVG